MIGNLTSALTPKRARSIPLARYLVSYIEGYKGGRNESMMYGVDTILNNERSWIDYDLTSAYTTVMSILGHPDTEKAVRVFNNTVVGMSIKDLLFNYIILDVEFEFPEETKYPSIPTRVDDNVDIYPLKGRSMITGCEYLVAKKAGCRLIVKDGVLIPFKLKTSRTGKNKNKNKNTSLLSELDLHNYVTPYRGIMKRLQKERRKHPKKTFYNYIYKLIANAIYGLVSMGISGKNSFDTITKSYVRVEGGELSNPILSSYITGFTRALIGECLHNISKLGGNIVSVTTDGFITDVDNLENKLLQLDSNFITCLTIYKIIRGLLTQVVDHSELKNLDTSDPEVVKGLKGDNSALEIKNIEDNGLIS